MTEVILLISALFIADNHEFLKEAKEQMEQGAKWHYVGHQKIDPNAKGIPMQCVDQSGKPCGEKFILWKLKKNWSQTSKNVIGVARRPALKSRTVSSSVLAAVAR